MSIAAAPSRIPVEPPPDAEIVKMKSSYQSVMTKFPPASKVSPPTVEGTKSLLGATEIDSQAVGPSDGSQFTDALPAGMRSTVRVGPSPSESSGLNLRRLWPTRAEPTRYELELSMARM